MSMRPSGSDTWLARPSSLLARAGQLFPAMGQGGNGARTPVPDTQLDAAAETVRCSIFELHFFNQRREGGHQLCDSGNPRADMGAAWPAITPTQLRELYQSNAGRHEIGGHITDRAETHARARLGICLTHTHGEGEDESGLSGPPFFFAAAQHMYDNVAEHRCLVSVQCLVEQEYSALVVQS